ncbi:MAG: hypothetical protein LBF41_07825 [Deltaproteobacteria bacterium]|jgi:hypothetical protein|nr:hypothetical protein [Deltaproteobacteria bacterium]
MRKKGFAIIGSVAVILMFLAPGCGKNDETRETAPAADSTAATPVLGEGDTLLSVTLIMDKIAGGSLNWNVGKREYEPGRMTLNGVTIMPALRYPTVTETDLEIAEFDETDGTETDLSGTVLAEMYEKEYLEPVTVAKIVFENVTDPAILKAILEKEDYESTVPARLAERIVLTGARQTVEGDKINRDTVLDEIVLENAGFSAALPDTTTGAWGFARNFVASRVAWTGGEFTFETLNDRDKVKGTISTGSGEMTDLSFAGDFGKTGDPADILMSYSAGASFGRDFKVDIDDFEKTRLELSVANFVAEGIGGFQNHEKSEISDFRVKLSTDGSDIPESIELALAKFAMNGFDYTEGLKRKIAAVKEFVENDFDDEVFLDTTTWDTFLTYPYDLASASLEGLELKASDGFAFGVAEASLEGPISAFKLSSSKTKAKGVTIAIPKKSDKRYMDGIIETAEFLGKNDFEIGLDAETVYDEAANTTSFALNDFTVKDLFRAGGRLVLEGMNQELADFLSEIPVRNVSLGLIFSPQVSGLGVKEYSVNYKDDSLADTLVRRAAEREGEDPASLRESLSRELPENFKEKLLYDYQIEVNEGFADAIAKFLADPGEFTLTVAPIQSVSPISGIGFEDPFASPQVIAASLNITLSANGGPAENLVATGLPTANPLAN